MRNGLWAVYMKYLVIYLLLWHFPVSLSYSWVILFTMEEYTEKKKKEKLYIYIKASTYLYVSFYLTCSQSMKDKFHVKWKLNLCYNLYVLLCLRRTGYVKVFQQSVVYFSWGKQRWLHVFVITSHVTTVCLSCHTVIIPHKQDRYHCTDTTPFFFTIIAAFFYLM